MNLINKRLKKRGSSKFLRRKLAYTYSDIVPYGSLQLPDDIPDPNGNEWSFTSSGNDDDFGNYEIIENYLDSLSEDERIQALEDLNLSEDEDDIDEITDKLTDCAKSGNIPNSWKDIVPKLHKLWWFSIPDYQNCACSINKKWLQNAIVNYTKVMPEAVSEVMSIIKKEGLKTDNRWSEIYDLCKKYWSSHIYDNGEYAEWHGSTDDMVIYYAESATHIICKMLDDNV